MKVKRVEFHKLRYPAHLAKIPQLSRAHVEELYAEVDSRRNSHGYDEFLRWCAENKTALESPIFKSYYAIRQMEVKEKRWLFWCLSSISDHYSVSLEVLGGWSSFLSRSHQDCDETIQLTRLLLVEIAIFEFTFTASYSEQLASAEYREWLEKKYADEAPYAQKEAPEKDVADAKLRVKRADLSSEHLNLVHEEQERLSHPDHDLEFDHDRSSEIRENIAQDTDLNDLHPLSLEGIKDTLKRWDNAGRHRGWKSLVIRRRQEFDRLDRIADQARAANPVEDRDFAETLWIERVYDRLMQIW